MAINLLIFGLVVKVKPAKLVESEPSSSGFVSFFSITMITTYDQNISLIKFKWNHPFNESKILVFCKKKGLSVITSTINL